MSKRHGAKATKAVSADFFTDLAREPANQNPHNHLHELRGEGLPRLETGEIVIVGHADAVDILRDVRFTKPSLVQTPLREMRTFNRMFLLLNQPDHNRLRQVVAPWFAERAVVERRSQITNATLEQVAGRRELDVVGDVGYPLPLRLISTWLGVQPGDEGALSAWGRTLAAAVDEPVPINVRQTMRFLKASLQGRTRPLATIGAVKGLVKYGSERITDEYEVDDASFLSLLRGAHVSGAIDLDEAVATWILMVVAGHETTANLIGNAMYCLLSNPDQLRKVSADRTLVAKAVDESLRYETPVPYTARVATEDIDIPSGRVAKGETAIVVLGAANRDPAVFEEPDRFDIAREVNPHLGFAHGSHFCIGHQVARMETEIAIDALVQRSPRLLSEPEWRASYGTRGLSQLHVELQDQPQS